MSKSLLLGLESSIATMKECMDAALTVLSKLAMRQHLMLHEGMLAIVLPVKPFWYSLTVFVYRGNLIFWKLNL